MHKDKILNQAEKLNHTQRWAYMIKLGKDSVHNPKLAKSLDELAHSEIHYERILALFSAHGSHDKQLISHFLEEPSSIYASFISQLAAAQLDEDILLNLMPKLSKSRRESLFRHLLRAKREKVNDKLCATLDFQAQKELLPFTSKEFIAQRLNVQNMQDWSVLQLRRICFRFPSLVYPILAEYLKRPTEPSWVIRSTVFYALIDLYRISPELGMSLMEQAFPRMRLEENVLKLYARLYPQKIATLLLTHKSNHSVTFSLPALKKLNDETLCVLAGINAIAHLQSLFSSLLPAQRELLYHTQASAWRDATGALPIHIVQHLSTQLREKEGLHAFHLTGYASQPLFRARYLLALPFTQALSLGAPFLSQPDGEIRAATASALVLSGRYDSASLSPILDFCVKRENEQDPVRMAMVVALSELPPTRWTDAHLPQIKTIIDAALRARDCSRQTMFAAAKWLLRMIKTQTEFVAHELPRIIERMGSFYVNLSLESQMTDKEMQQLAPALMPTLNTWARRSHSQFVLGLICCFGRRAKAVPAFAKLIVEFTQDKRGHVASHALSSLLQLEFYAEVRALIPRLIQKDVGWIQEQSVKEYLHRHHQNLLTPFLQPQIYKGRFSSGRTKMLVAFDGGFYRWTAFQQNIYADAINGIVKSNQRNAWELRSLVDRLSLMPSIRLDALIHLSRPETKDQALRDFALSALGRVDAGRGVPTLLEAQDDSRARVAIYALRSALLDMPPQQALEVLSQIYSEKVTVQKEVIRLIGDVGGVQSYAALGKFMGKSDALHPDVHIALLRALWGHLEHEEAWELLHAAAQNPHEALARSTIRIPQEGLTEKGRQHLCKQMALLLRYENAQVRRETLDRLVALPLGMFDATLKDMLMAQLESIENNVCQAAAQALIAMCQAEHSDELIKAFSPIKRVQSLVAVVDAYEQRRLTNTYGLEVSAQGVLENLLQRRWQPSLAVRLALLILPTSQSLSYMHKVEEAGLMHPGVVTMVMSRVFSTMMNQVERAELLTLEEQLRGSKNVMFRRMGLRLIKHLGASHGWTDDKKETLKHYQQDKELWVRDAAELIEPPETAA